MALFDFTAEDVARGAILQPAWYNLQVKKVEDGIAKSSGKPKVDVHLVCMDGKDHEGNDVPNVPLQVTFSPEYPSFAINFCNALGAGIGKDGKKGVNITPDLVGKRLMGYVKNDQYEGRTVNKVADYRPTGS